MARYFNSQLVQPISNFVPENLGFYQNKLEDLQGKQDAFNLSVEGLNKQTGALVNDIPGAMAAKQQLEAKIQQLRDINYNDPRQQQAAIKEISTIRNAFSPFGELGVREEKKKKYELQESEINKDKNDFKKAYRLKELKKINLSPENAIKFDSYGRPVNTEIIVPEDFEYKDLNKTLSEHLKDVTSDMRSVNTNLTPEAAQEALMSYMNGNIEERTGEKIYNSLKQRAVADPNLMKSIEAEADYFNRDAKELFETALSGVVGGGKFRKSNLDKKYERDNMTEYKAKQSLQDEKSGQRFTTETGAVQSDGSWAKIAGLDNFFNEDGSVKSSTSGNFNIVTFDKNGKQEIVKYGSEVERRQGELEKEKQGFKIIKRDEDKQSLDKKIVEGQSALYSKTSKLGLNITRPDGTLDGEATKQNAINYFKGLSVYSNYTVPFIDNNIVTNISKDLFGSTSNIHNMEIYEQGNPNSRSQYESKEVKNTFKDSRAVGLDYTADKPGAMKIIAPIEHDSDGKPQFGDKPFVAISRNKTLQEQMAPIQELTVKSLNGARTGNKDKAAEFLTNSLSGDIVKDIYGHNVKLESLGIPVGSSKDTDGTLRISYLDNSSGSPVIQVLEKRKNVPGITIKSLDEVQQERTGKIFNKNGALSQYQKQTGGSPSIEFQDSSEK